MTTALRSLVSFQLCEALCPPLSFQLTLRSFALHKAACTRGKEDFLISLASSIVGTASGQACPQGGVLSILPLVLLVPYTACMAAWLKEKEACSLCLARLEINSSVST